ncbi:MAG TPA: hypothetical protein VHN14_33310 [Kofleriaceae bacterium]|nr:hypothetical protein [Kofleriaceae bacterium]
MMSIAVGILFVAQAAAAQPDPALDALDKALPAGWTLLVTDTELVIRHDRPCYVTGARHENASPGDPTGEDPRPVGKAVGVPTPRDSPTGEIPRPAGKAVGGPSPRDSASLIEAKVSSAGAGSLVTIQLRYRLEPRWTDQQLVAARAANDKLGVEIRALAATYRIDAIHRSKGRPVPANPDERARLEAYEARQAQLAARLVKLPRGSLGDASVFDGEDTYAQLLLEIDPPEVMTEAHHIVAIMTQHCG